MDWAAWVPTVRSACFHLAGNRVFFGSVEPDWDRQI
jgi:hypothetical protein